MGRPVVLAGVPSFRLPNGVVMGPAVWGLFVASELDWLGLDAPPDRAVGRLLVRLGIVAASAA